VHVIEEPRIHREHDGSGATPIKCSSCGAAAALMVESIQLHRGRPGAAHVEYSCLKCDCVYAATIDRLNPDQIFLDGAPLRDLRGATLAHCGTALERSPLSRGVVGTEPSEATHSGYEILSCHCGFRVELNYRSEISGAERPNRR